MGSAIALSPVTTLESRFIYSHISEQLHIALWEHTPAEGAVSRGGSNPSHNSIYFVIIINFYENPRWHLWSQG